MIVLFEEKFKSKEQKSFISGVLL